MADKAEQARGTAADATGGAADAAGEAARAGGAATEPGTHDIHGAAEHPSDRPPSKQRGRLAGAFTAVFAPVRWLRSKAASGLRWLSRQLKSPLRLLAGLAKPRAAEERGFGFWWLVVTVLLAASVGLLVAVLLTPVTGILAFLAVGIWALLRRRRAARRGDETSSAPAATTA